MTKEITTKGDNSPSRTTWKRATVSQDVRPTRATTPKNDQIYKKLNESTHGKSTTQTNYRQNLVKKLADDYGIKDDDLTTHSDNVQKLIYILSGYTIPKVPVTYSNNHCAAWQPIPTTYPVDPNQVIADLKDFLNKLGLSCITTQFSSDKSTNIAPLVKKLHEAESSKYGDNSLENAAIKLNLLIKINSILDQTEELILNALQTVVNSQYTNSEEEEKTEKDENEEQVSEEADTSIIYLCNQLKLSDNLLEQICKKLGIASTEMDDDESSEPHGFFASIGYAIWHPIETLQSIKQKIWDKAEPENVSNGERETHNNGGEGNDNSNSYFEPIFTPIKAAFTWIFSLGEFFSTHSETAAKQNSTDLLNKNQGGESEDDDLDDNDGTLTAAQKPREFKREQPEYTPPYYNSRLTKEEYESSYLNSYIPENDGNSSDSDISGEGYYWKRPPTDPFNPQYGIYGNMID